MTARRGRQPKAGRGRARTPSVVYLDSSALVKTVVWEPASGALRRFLLHHPVRISSALARTEVVRAVRHLGPQAVVRAGEVLARIELVRLDDTLLDAAAGLDPRVLRSLDAIHLATARAVSGRLSFVVTYDERMVEGASLLGLPVATPE